LLLEHVRREELLGPSYGPAEFADAFRRFVELYNVRPTRVICAPDVLQRFCSLFERSPDVAHRHSTSLRYEGVPVVAAILAPGTIAFEGEVDEERMGDW
jgi:hypothetical protein